MGEASIPFPKPETLLSFFSLCLCPGSMWEVDGDEVEGEGKAAAKRSLPRTADLVGDWGGRGSGQRLRLGGGRLDCSGQVGTVLTMVG
jgi:hypothetical protein